MPKIKKVLVANRGEIALRIMRTCRELDRIAVAIYSEADRKSAHVVYADEAYCVGPARASESYLNMRRILEVAQSCQADAIHPGYGFLSERAAFARLCEEKGVTFIGPPWPVIQAMGDKTEARRLMQAHGVPVVPGTDGEALGMQAAARKAEEIGFPVLIKAAAGGGGKGMRKVDKAQELRQAMALAQSEAQSAFGDPRVFIEKYLDAPRHIEVQILADTHGNRVHLFERECSIQRRHQKIIEEAPACIMTPELRRAMGEAALRAAAACNYVGAGTVEFLVDRARRFFFMEMNTRLQVEHPVTELITGLDLVAEQIRIAEGVSMPFAQQDLNINGHAIECRIYAEDPSAGFLPDPGRMRLHEVPAGVGVRVDAGYDGPGEVPVHYDPMIAKVVVWGRTREESSRRMARALRDYQVAGVKTTLPYCLRVMESAPWQHGELSTHFVQDYPELTQPEAVPYAQVAALAAVLHRQDNSASPTHDARSAEDGWLQRRSF